MQFHGGSCAHVTPGRIWLAWRDKTITAKHAGSTAQGMRFAERWIAVQRGLPHAHKGARESREKMAAREAHIDALYRIIRSQSSAPGWR